MSWRVIDESVPCYKCPSRNAGCHATCSEYAAFRFVKEESYEMRRVNSSLCAMTINTESINKRMRRQIAERSRR